MWKCGNIHRDIIPYSLAFSKETLTLFGYVRMTGTARMWFAAGIGHTLDTDRLIDQLDRYRLAAE